MNLATDLWSLIEKNLEDRDCFQGIDDDIMKELRKEQIETIYKFFVWKFGIAG